MTSQATIEVVLPHEGGAASSAPGGRRRSSSAVSQPASRSTARASASGGSLTNVAVWIGSSLIILLVVAALVFQGTGGRFFIVETPSMGTAAPVGTLVLDRPTTVAALEVGDIITFHPPAVPAEVYTHRIVAISPSGGITTRGDINGTSDGWVLTQQNLIGKAVAVLPTYGWLVRSAPLMLALSVLLWLLTALVRSPTLRSAYRVTGLSVAATITALILHPFVNVDMLETTTGPSGPIATIVSTGILPVRVQAVGGDHLDLVSGQVGHIQLPLVAHSSHYLLNLALHLGFVDWGVLLLICSLPLLSTLIIGLPGDPLEEKNGTRR